MKRSVFTVCVYSLIKILLAVLLFTIPQASVIQLWIKIVFALIVSIDIIIDVLVICNCFDIVKTVEEKANYRWSDRKRTFLGLPWSFTKYRLSNEKLIVNTGFLNTKESEMRLYRITDLDLTRSFGQRLLGLGTITVHSSDKTDQILLLESVKRPEYVKEIVSDFVEKERIRKRVSGREIIDSRVDELLNDDSCNCDCDHNEE